MVCKYRHIFCLLEVHQKRKCYEVGYESPYELHLPSGLAVALLSFLRVCISSFGAPVCAAQHIRFCNSGDDSGKLVVGCLVFFSRWWMLSRPLQGSLEVMYVTQLPTQKMQPPSSKLPSIIISQKGAVHFETSFSMLHLLLVGYLFNRAKILLLGTSVVIGY